MKKTTRSFILLVSLLTLAAAPLAGCSDDSDPSGGNNAGGQDTGGQDTGGQDTGGGDSGGQDTHVQDTGVDTMDTGGGDAADTDGGLGSCTVNDFFSGQTYTEGDNVDPQNGGKLEDAASVTLDAAGLQAVYDAVPVDDPATDDTDESKETVTLDPALQVDGATVIATTGPADDPSTPDIVEGNDHFWLQDADTTVVFYRAFADGQKPSDPIQVGDKVSFSVGEVKNYSGTPEITSVSDFSAESPADGAAENPVPFTDLTGQEITADYWNQLVRVSGQLTENTGECGSGYTCFTLEHGGQTIEYRINDNGTSAGGGSVEVGKCLTFVGPLSTFPTPLSAPEADVTPQINSTNFDWTFTEAAQ